MRFCSTDAEYLDLHLQQQQQQQQQLPYHRHPVRYIRMPLPVKHPGLVRNAGVANSRLMMMVVVVVMMMMMMMI